MSDDPLFVPRDNRRFAYASFPPGKQWIFVTVERLAVTLMILFAKGLYGDGAAWMRAESTMR